MNTPPRDPLSSPNPGDADAPDRGPIAPPAPEAGAGEPVVEPAPTPAVETPAAETAVVARLTAQERLQRVLEAAQGAAQVNRSDLAAFFASALPLSHVDPENMSEAVKLLKELEKVMREGSQQHAIVTALRDPAVRAYEVRQAQIREELLALGVNASEINGSLAERLEQLTQKTSDVAKQDRKLDEVSAKARAQAAKARGQEQKDELTALHREGVHEIAVAREQDEAAHVKRVNAASEALYGQYVTKTLPEVQANQLAEERGRNERMRNAVWHVNGWMIPMITVGSAAASGWFTYLAFDGMTASLAERPEGINGMAALGATLLNGGLATLALMVQRSVVSVHPFPKSIDARGQNRRRFNMAALGVLGLHACGSITSGALNVGGAAADQAPDLVIATSWAKRETVARSFVADAKETLEPNQAQTAEKIEAVRSQGTRLVLESSGQWSADGNADYGYRTRSQGEMESFRVNYSTTAQELAGAGDCRGLEDLQTAGFGTVDQLETLRQGDPNFAPGLPAFSRAPFDLSGQIARCRELNPDRNVQMDAVVTRLDEVTAQINNGEIEGTYKLNLVIRRLNPILIDVATELGMPPVQLDPFDPIAQEGALLALYNAKNAFETIQGQTPDQRVSWTLLVLTIIMLTIDQVGLIGAMGSKYAEARVKDGYEQERRQLAKPLDS